MSELYAIEVQNISKKFKVFLDKGKTLKEFTLFSKRRHYEERLVLKNISFNVKKGGAIGLIGQNGCGKSTTLKLLSKIMYPDSGTIIMRGRVSSLIELGAGFHPDMSGRQNIYTNAAIFGLTRKEIDLRIEKIIVFSELEDFIDNPVRTYSSGMYMRLAFSVAINVDADILLIDEILAVGDAAFQAKCFNKLKEIKSQGTTIVIVSHSLGQIEQICERSIWIHDGEIKADGLPRDIHPMYLNYMSKTSMKVDSTPKPIPTSVDIDEHHPMCADEAKKINRVRWGNKKVSILNVQLRDANNNETLKFVTGEKMTIQVDYEINENIDNPVIGVGFWENTGTRYYGSNTQMDHVDIPCLLKGNINSFVYEIPQIPFLNGEYQLEIAFEDLDTCEQLDYWLDVLHFQVNSTTNELGLVRINHVWNFSH